MKTIKFILKVIILTVFLMNLNANIFADGAFAFQDIANEKLPEIPYQTALIVHSNGIEKLTIQSSMKTGASEEYAWILPLPSVPVSIEKQSPGILNTLRHCFNAKINSTSDVNKAGPIFLLLISLLLTISYIDPNYKSKVIDIIVVLTIIGILSMISVADMGSAAVSGSTQVLTTIDVGNYEVKVLKPIDFKSFNNWLTENKFKAFPENMSVVIDDYIRNRWIFLSAKLKKTSSGIMVPHPIEVSFPAEIPIYPMRLTAAPNTDTDVTIFMLSNKEHITPLFEKILSGNVRANQYSISCNEKYIQEYPEITKIFQTDNVNFLTRMHAKLKPEDMKSDIYLNPVDSGQPFEKTYYTTRAAAVKAIVIIIWILTFGILIIGIIFKNKQQYGKTALIILVILSLIPAGIVYRSLEKVKNVKTIHMGNVKEIKHKSDIRKEVVDLMNSGQFAGESLLTAIEKALTEDYKNFYTGEKIKREHSPGNFDFVVSKEGVLSFVYYSRDCYPSEIPLVIKQ